MKVETFTAGKWQQRFEYKSFEPVPINVQWQWEDARINAQLERATLALGELNAFSLIVPDVDQFIRMHIVKEAQASSRIEGTQTQLDEALMPEDQIAPEKRDDWIGGSSLSDAVFIPPHQDGVPELMGDLESFWHNREITVPHLIRVAISHYQFETIHPFLDGNGRIGRLLIPLYLISHGLLAKPSLYISDFFERNRASYYDALMAVRVQNDMRHWLLFFLSGIEKTANFARGVFREILLLRDEIQATTLKMGRRAELANKLLHILYANPVQTAQSIETELNVVSATANALIRQFVENGILIEVTGQRRGRVYSFDRYFRVFLQEPK